MRRIRKYVTTLRFEGGPMGWWRFRRNLEHSCWDLVKEVGPPKFERRPTPPRKRNAMTKQPRPLLPKFQKGDRVVSDFFGAGTFEANDYFGLGLALVTWDRRPPREYNMGNNPCTVDPAELRPEKSDG